jgi:hypothetical protein
MLWRGIGDWCQAKILIGGVEANPKADVDASVFALDSNDSADGANSWEGHQFARSRVVSNTGARTKLVPVVVKVLVTSGSLTFWVDDFQLQASAYRSGAGLA